MRDADAIKAQREDDKKYKPVIDACRKVFAGFTGKSVDELAAFLGTHPEALRYNLPVRLDDREPSTLKTALLPILPAPLLDRLAGEESALDDWSRLLTKLSARPMFESKDEAALGALVDRTIKACPDPWELKLYFPAAGARLRGASQAHRDRFVAFVVRRIARMATPHDGVFGLLAVGDDGQALERLIVTGGTKGSLDDDALRERIALLPCFPEASRSLSRVVDALGARIPRTLLHVSPEVTKFAPDAYWRLLLQNLDDEGSMAANLAVALIAGDDELTARLRGLTDAQLNALVRMPLLDGYFEPGARTALTRKLGAALAELGAQRKVAWDKKVVPSLKRYVPAKVLARLASSGSASGASLPVIPANARDAFAMLARLSVRLPKAARKAAPADLPASLRAIYEHTASAPSGENWLYSVEDLAKLRRDFGQELDALVGEEGALEGLPREHLSATEHLVPFGKPAHGGYYFLDPKRHGDTVFLLDHDPEDLRVVASSITAFIATQALVPWANANGTAHELDTFVTKDAKAAKKAVTHAKKRARNEAVKAKAAKTKPAPAARKKIPAGKKTPAGRKPQPGKKPRAGKKTDQGASKAPAKKKARTSKKSRRR